MLQRTPVDAAYCYQRAEECRRLASRVDTPKAFRRDLEDMETRWLSLARSYDFAASLNTYIDTQIKG